MSRWVLTLAWVTALIGGVRAQEEVQEGKTYVSKQHQVTFSIPSKDWGTMRIGEALEFGWDGGVCEILSKDEMIGGCLAIEEVEDFTAEKYADAFDELMSKNEAIKNFKRLKSEKAGEWVRREYNLEYQETVTHWIVQFTAKGKRVYRFGLWTLEAKWNDLKGELVKIGDSCKVTAEEGSGTGGGSGTGESGGGGGEKISNPWEKWAEGSWVELKITNTVPTETEMTQKQTLVKKEAEELTLKVEGKMTKPAAMEMPASDMKLPLKGSGATGGGGGANTSKVLGKGEEELEVGGKKVKCTWVETEMDAAGSKITVKTWTSDEVPGGTVKSITKGESVNTEMVAIAFEGKK